MSANRFITLFDGRERREVAGRMIVPQTMDPRSKAVLVQRLRINYDMAETIDEKLSILDLLESLQTDLGELGFTEDHASELINYYDLSHTAPSRFKALGYAAKFKTNHFARPALTMACLHANEIDINNDIIPGMKASISSTYRNFGSMLNKAGRLSCAVALAELGSKSSIRDLIDWHQSGCKEMGIEPDANMAARWKVKLDGIVSQLLKPFHDYFQIEMERIARFEVQARRREAAGLNTKMLKCRDFCLMAGETQFRDMKPHEFFLHMMERTANNNNLYAMYYLMIRANTFEAYPFNDRGHAYKLSQAKKWSVKIADTFYDQPCRMTAEAAYLKYCLSDQNDTDNCILLLEHACALGSERGKCHLPENYLQKNRIDEALQVMQEVLAQQDEIDNDVIRMGMNSNIRVVWAHASLVSFYIDFNLTYIRGHYDDFSYILDKLKETGNSGLFAKWNAIRGLHTAADYPDLAEATKEALKVPEADKRLRR